MITNNFIYVVQLVVFTFISTLSSASYGQSYEAFLRAVEDGDAKVVAEYLGKGLDPNTPDKGGHTALMIASRLGHENLVALLVDRKADTGRRSPQGDTALMMASLKGHLGVARILVDRGVPVRHEGWAPLHYAAFEGRDEMVRYLLDKGADKDAIAPNGYSALMLAARGGHTDSARILLQDDADFRIASPDGATALRIALARNEKVLVELLRRAGAVD
ncbi:MAG: ankyrin repeat domain-containing protein [Betaproteobacteria bacterium]